MNVLGQPQNQPNYQAFSAQPKRNDHYNTNNEYYPHSEFKIAAPLED